MRKNIFQLLSVTLLACLLIFSCQREKSYINPDGSNPTNNSSAKIITSVGGRVVDEKNVPIQGAQIRAGSAIALTDINGSFFLADIELENSLVLYKL